jgi:hypothetical protein
MLFVGSGAYKAPNLDHIIQLKSEAYDSYLRYQASPNMPCQAKPLFNYPISKVYLLKTSTLCFFFFGSGAYRAPNLDHIKHLTAEAYESYLSIYLFNL